MTEEHIQETKEIKKKEKEEEQLKETEQEKLEELEKKVEKEEQEKQEKEAESEQEEQEDTEKKKRKEEKIGIACITSSANNTIVHITDLAGNTISRISGGMVTKHSRLKSNPTIAMFVAKRAAERARDLGFTSLYVRMKGQTNASHGPGAHAAIKSLGKEGFNIISILDVTKFPRGGPKKKGGRRGRRV
jgi:small subunit ribosomal protein S11